MTSKKNMTTNRNPRRINRNKGGRKKGKKPPISGYYFDISGDRVANPDFDLVVNPDAPSFKDWLKTDEAVAMKEESDIDISLNLEDEQKRGK